MARECTSGPIIALTLGDIAGIGPEIVAKVLAEGPGGKFRLLVVDDAEVLRSSLRRLDSSIDPPIVGSAEELSAADYPFAVLNLGHANERLLALGRPDPGSGKMAALALTAALRLAMDHKVDGVVYPPLCKETLDLGDGEHGDELELVRKVTDSSGIAQVLKIRDLFRTSVTGHVPFVDISSLLTSGSVLNSIEVLQEGILWYGRAEPRIAVAALNPHAGESGQVGREEIDVIRPAVETAVSKGIDAVGPVPADTIYVRAFGGEFDGVVSLYHDQGNIAAKAAGFGEGVLLYIRAPTLVASVGHGAAFDIAGKGVADSANLRLVLEEVARLAHAGHS